MKDPDTLLLIAAGPHRHTPALQRAFDLARAGEMPVHVCLLAHDPLIERSASLVHPDVRQLAQREFLDQHRAWLEQLAARWTADGLKVTTEALWAPVAHEAILSRVLDLNPALVVKDAGHEPLLKRLLYTALDWKLLRYLPAPLLLVHPRSGHLPRRILAAVDTTAAMPDIRLVNDRVIAEALKHGDLADAEVHLAHVFPYLPIHTPPARTLEQVCAETRDADRGTFDAFAAAHHVPADHRHWLEGNPAGRLVELLGDQEIDLLVLGSAYRSALDRLFLGSTAESLLFQLPCDVLLVKPRDFVEELGRHFDLRAVQRRVGEAAGDGAQQPTARVA